jgi:small subunit ribosomal protein S20
MATHKSAIKAHRRSEKNKARNIGILSRIKTFVKKVEAFITEGNQDEAKVALRKAESEIMKGVSKKVIKKNAAARKVSRLNKRVKAAGKGSVAASTTKKKSSVKKKKPTAKKVSKK